MILEEMAKIIEAEAGVLDYKAKLAVGQCIVDNDYNEKAFTKPANYASDDSIKAAKETMNGYKRFPEYKLLQFRSFTNYSDGNGNPDWNKLKSGKCPIPDNYLYIGKDGVEPWGHFYFGILNTPDHNNELKLTVVYGGADGVNLRSTPDFGNNIVGVIYKGGMYTVVGKSDNERFWKLKSGVYVSADPLFTRVFEGRLVNYQVRVKIRDLNIRMGHGTNYANYTEPIPRGVYTIVEECSGLGSKTGWGLLLSYKNKRNGWISLDYAERV